MSGYTKDREPQARVYPDRLYPAIMLSAHLRETGMLHFRQLYLRLFRDFPSSFRTCSVSSYSLQNSETLNKKGCHLHLCLSYIHFRTCRIQ